MLLGGSVAASAQYVAAGGEGLTTVPGAAAVYDATSGARLSALANPSASNGDLFGRAVAVGGTYVVVGAPGDDTSGTNTGRAYVFDATTGGLVSTLVNPAPDPNAQSMFGSPEGFGNAVAIIGSTVFVAADLDPQPAGNSGNVYEFDAATGNYLGVLTPPAAAQSRHFGTALAAAGSRLAVSAALAGPNFEGQVYVYNPSVSTAAPEVTIDEPGTQGVQDWFGQSLALDGSTLVVGAPLRDVGGNTDVGVAYVFGLPAGAVPRPCSGPSTTPTRTTRPPAGSGSAGASAWRTAGSSSGPRSTTRTARSTDRPTCSTPPPAPI